MTRTLDQQQIRNLLLKEQSGVAAPVWPTRKDRARLYAAAVKKNKTVTFADGSVFACKYATKKSIAWGEHEQVYIKPATGGVTPCGWFRIKSLLAEK